MIASIINQILQIFISSILPKIIRKEADRIRAEKALQTALSKYQKGVGSAARIRDTERELDKELGKEWEERWGKPAPTTPPATSLAISAPAQVKVNDEFRIFFHGNSKGFDLYADSCRLSALVGREECIVKLNTAGKRELKVVNGTTVVASTVVEVVE